MTTQWARGLVLWAGVTVGVACGSSARDKDAELQCAAPECGASAGKGGGAGEGELVGGMSGGPAASSSERLGLRCTSDEDCGGTLYCLRSHEDYADGAGSPAGGMCTHPCVTQADCEALGPNAVCGSLAEDPLDREAPPEGAPRLCLQACSNGAPAGESKCHGRPELACRPFAPPSPLQCERDGSCPNGGQCYRDICRSFACGPRCNSDADCGEGRFCNTQTGLCDVRKRRAVPVGAACDTDRMVPGLCGNGTCLALFDEEGVRVKSMCTHSCTLGQACGEGAACTLPRFHAIVGDIAYCNEICNCNEDCRQSTDACVPWDAPHIAEHYGSQGSCQPQARDETTLSCAAVSDADQFDPSAFSPPFVSRHVPPRP